VNSSELLDVGEALAKCPLPKGSRIAILTDGGGHGAMGSDAAEKYGLKVPVLSEETQGKLRQFMVPQSILKNPIDFAGAAETDLWNFVRCSEILLQDKDIDGLVIVGQYGGYGIEMASEFSELEERVSDAITKLVKKYNKPIINHSMYQPSRPKSLQILSDGGVPVYPTVETAMKCMSALAQYRSYLDRFEEEEKEEPIALPADRVSGVRTIIGKVRDAGRVNLVETEAREILKAYSLPMSDFKLARSKDEAIEVAKGIGYPVAMKIVSPHIIRKSDAGGVKLNLKNKEDVAKAFTEITNNARAYNKEAEIYGVIVTPMEDKGVETIIGMTSDQTFGPTIMFGLGGIFVEALKDVSFRVAPLTRKDAYDMIKQIKGFPILKGARGQKPADIDALAAAIMKVSTMVMENPHIKQLDLNPVLAFRNGVSVVDARIMLV
jgi:acetyltransferase